MDDIIANFTFEFATPSSALNKTVPQPPATALDTFLYYYESESEALNCIRDGILLWLVFGVLTIIARHFLLKLYYTLRGPKLYIYSIDKTAKPITSAVAAPNEFPCPKTNTIIFWEYFHMLFVLKMIVVAVPFMLKSDSTRYFCFWSYILMTMLLYSMRNYTFQPFALLYTIWTPAYQFLVASDFGYIFLGLFDPDAAGAEYWYSHFAPPIFLWLWLFFVGRHYLVRSDELIPMVASWKHTCFSIMGSWPLMLIYAYFNNPNRTYRVMFRFIPWMCAAADFCIIIGTQLYLMGIVIVFNRYYQYLASKKVK